MTESGKEAGAGTQSNGIYKNGQPHKDNGLRNLQLRAEPSDAQTDKEDGGNAELATPDANTAHSVTEAGNDKK